MEVNSSPGLEGIEEVSGVDIAGLMIAQCERQSGLAAPPRALALG